MFGSLKKKASSSLGYTRLVGGNLFSFRNANVFRTAASAVVSAVSTTSHVVSPVILSKILPDITETSDALYLTMGVIAAYGLLSSLGDISVSCRRWLMEPVGADLATQLAKKLQKVTVI